MDPAAVDYEEAIGFRSKKQAGDDGCGNEVRAYFGAPTCSKYMSNFFPPLQWGPEYWVNFKNNIKGDLIGAVTVGAMLVPQSMAYSLLAGMEPIDGLYAASIPLLIYPFLGTSRHQNPGPTALVGLLSAGTVGSILTGDDFNNREMYAKLTLVIAMVTGLIQLVMGLGRMGIIVRFLSYSVMAGFTTAAAFVIGISQLKYLFGIKVPRFTGPGSNAKTLGHIIGHLDDSSPWTILLGVISLLFLGLLRWWKANKWALIKANAEKQGSKVAFGWQALLFIADMSSLLVTVLGICIALIYNSAGLNVMSSLEPAAANITLNELVNVVGPVPSGFGTIAVPRLDSFSEWEQILPNAIVISIIGFMELFAVGKVYAARDGYEIDPNQELVALGVSNVVASCFGSFAIGGCFSRTAVNASTGASSLLSCFVVGIIVTMALMFLAPLFYYIPMATLAAIIEIALLGLVKVSDFKMAWKLNKGDFVAMFITFIATFLLSIQEGIMIGVILSVVIQLRRTVFPSVGVLGQVPGTVVFEDLARHGGDGEHGVVELIQSKGVLVLHPRGDIFFANAKEFAANMHKQIRIKSARAVVVSCAAVCSIDLQGLLMFETLVKELSSSTPPVQITFAGMQARVRKAFAASGVFDLVKTQPCSVSFFLDLSNAVAAAQAYVAESGGEDANLLANPFMSTAGLLTNRHQSAPALATGTLREIVTDEQKTSVRI